MRSRLLCSVLLAMLCLPAHAGENILTPMIGFTSWSDDSDHTARGNSLAFKDSNELTLGFRYLYMFDNGVALGGNFYIHDKDVTTTTQANDAGVLHIHGLVEYFFNPRGGISPFIGGGIGVSSIGFDGGNLDGDGIAGASIELNGGVIFKLSDLIGLQVEYKYTDFQMDESIDGFSANIDSSANSLLVGITLHL